MKKILLILLLSPVNLCFAAISLHGTQAGPNPFGGNVVQVLPAVSNNDLVIVGIAAAGTTTSRYCCAGGGKSITPPAGWTEICQVGNGGIFYHIWQTGDPTTVTFTSTFGFWETSAAISYSGVDTTTPIDQAACTFTGEQPGVSYSADGSILAPTTSPAWSGDQLVEIFMNTTPGSAAITVPSATTLRIGNAPGPAVYISDKALSSTANTGDMYASTSTITTIGSQILLKASGASSASFQEMPDIVAYFHGDATNPINLSDYYIQANDMVVIVWPKPTNCIGCSPITSVTSGYTLLVSNSNLAIAYGVYTGGSTSFGWSASGTSGGSSLYDVYLLRNTRGTKPISFDVFSTNTATSSTSISTASVAVALPNNSIMLTNFYNTDTTGGSFSSTLGAGQTLLSTSPGNNSTHVVDGVVDNPANPSGTFSATYSVSGNLEGVASVWKCAAATFTRLRKSQVY